MNGFIKKILASATVCSGLAAVGCTSDHYNKVADPCWPDRYSHEARVLAHAAFEPQVMNGEILDHTIWNSPVHHFEAGTDRLSPAGMDKLDQLARYRPEPASRIYLQTARDIAYDADKPGEYAAKRAELDTKRVAAIQKYLKASLAGRPATIDVQIHDPSYPGIDGAAPRVVVPNPRMRIGAGTGGGGAGTPGATPGGGAPGAGMPATGSTGGLGAPPPGSYTPATPPGM